MGREEVHTRTRFWWGNPKEKDHFEDLDVDGRILKFIFKKWGCGHVLD
jgi:hypothetical protein